MKEQLQFIQIVEGDLTKEHRDHYAQVLEVLREKLQDTVNLVNKVIEDSEESSPAANELAIKEKISQASTQLRYKERLQKERRRIEVMERSVRHEVHSHNAAFKEQSSGR
jgi:gamma-glutamyl:cysteine ligase YbdK (ATP-grasp superfamily)